jgi:predicted RNase H-like HicB family nuclease
MLLTSETAAVVLRLAAFVHGEEGLWVAGCPSLDVFSQGESKEEAQENLHEAVELWIDSCLERNTLSKALRELGWYRIPPGSQLTVPGVDVLNLVEPDPPRVGDLGQEYPLEVTIPAYQAALLSDSSGRAQSWQPVARVE